jgi:hypothetical protein
MTKIRNTFRKSTSLKKKYKRKTRKNNTKSRTKKGGQDPCCMCGKEISGKNPKIPSGCYMKHGKFRAHKICDDCWWDKFAKEGVNHQCPGCSTGQKLIAPPLKKEIIDLTED